MDLKACAIGFVKALCDRNYAGAYAMTSSGYQGTVSQEEMKIEFEGIAPGDGQPTVNDDVQLMADWPDKDATDEGMACVPLGGNADGQMVTLIVAKDGGGLKVRSVDWGGL